MLITIYKGEGRILVIPIVDCTATDWFVRMPDTADSLEVGQAVIDALNVIRKAASEGYQWDQNAVPAWQKNSSYKSWISFWKHNHFSFVEILKDGQYYICSQKKSETRPTFFDDIFKKIYLPADANAEEIGKAVIEVLEASEAYSWELKDTEAWRRQQVEMLDGTTLNIVYPKDSHFEDYQDCGVAEIYQCYAYLSGEGSEPSAEFFVGIAPELDCNLDEKNVYASWERVYGKADSFKMEAVDYGIFKYRAEMRNRSIHKTSYFLQVDEYELLECGMHVYQPNRRKKMDEKLAAKFEKFASDCSF